MTNVINRKRVIAWFSCGAASAYAAKLAIDKYSKNPEYNLEIIYCRVRQEHPSNIELLKQFEKKYDFEIKILEDEKHKGDIYNVFKSRKFLINQFGAPCTKVLKKDLRKRYQKSDDIQIFGYTAEEEERMNNFLDRNPEVQLENLLIDKNINKKDCLKFIESEGFDLPLMYKLGYEHNNCIGCVKGGMGYWNAIRRDFPETFDKMGKLERLLGHSINKDKNGSVYLDELAPDRGNFKRDLPPACGFNCEWKQLSLEDLQNDKRN